MARLKVKRRSPQEGWKLEDSKKYALYKNKEVLYDNYIVSNKSLRQTANTLNCSIDTVRDWLKKYNIKIRHNKLSLSYIKEKFEAEGYILLSKEYRNNSQKLSCVSPTGEYYSVTWRDWYSGHRHKRKEMPQFDIIKKSFENSGYTLLSTMPNNSQEKLLCVCDKGHKYKTSWNNWSRGNRCKICASKNTRGENHYKWKKYTTTDIKSIKKYYGEVWQETNQNFRKYYYLINPNKIKRGKVGGYQLDHSYSIKNGFENSILPTVIASPINLRMLPSTHNGSKGSRSDITKETLLQLYNQFKNMK